MFKKYLPYVLSLFILCGTFLGIPAALAEDFEGEGLLDIVSEALNPESEEDEPEIVEENLVAQASEEDEATEDETPKGDANEGETPEGDISDGDATGDGTTDENTPDDGTPGDDTPGDDTPDDGNTDEDAPGDEAGEDGENDGEENGEEDNKDEETDKEAPAKPTYLVGIPPETEGGMGAISGFLQGLSYDICETIYFGDEDTITITGQTKHMNYPGTYYVRVSAVADTPASQGFAVIIPKYGEAPTGNIPIEKVTINVPADKLYEGETLLFSTTIEPTNATDKAIIWSSSNSEVASVDSVGRVHGVNAGSATITAKSNDGSGVMDAVLVTVFPERVPEYKEGEEYSSSDSDLKYYIFTAPDGTQIKVDYTANSSISKEIFNVLRSANKSIKFVGGSGVEWIFNGKDIVNETKSINLRTAVEALPNSTRDSKAAVSKLVGSTPTLMVTFPDNGNLPGKALVRIPVGADLTQYVGSKGLYVYYHDPSAKKLVPIATNLSVTSDGYVEFYISHCSTYIVTAGPIGSSTSNNGNTNNGNGGTTQKAPSQATTTVTRTVRRNVSPKTGE